MRMRNLMIVGVSLLAVACGKDDNNVNGKPGDTGDDNNGMDMTVPEDMGNNTTPDMATPPDMTVPDMPSPDDMGTDMAEDMAEPDMAEPDMAPDMAGPCTYNTFVPAMEMVEYDDDPNLEFFKYTARDGTTGRLDLEIYPVFGGTLAPHTFTFTGENYEDCHTCMLAFICDPSCDEIFLVDSGTVDITALGVNAGDQFTATFSDIEMIQVTLDTATFRTEPVPDGDTWCINTLDASATTELAP